MRVVYEGPIDAVELPELRAVVKRGESIEVADDFGAALIEQRIWDTSPDEVLTWVGQDPGRAARLLVAEQDGARRPELLDHLRRLANPEPTVPPTTTRTRRAAQNSGGE